MMVKVIKENTELEVSDSIASDINKMLAEDPALPIHLNKNVLSFDEYTVGSIQVGELNLEIQPRNPVFTLEALFEMLLFESMNNFDENYLSSGFGDNNSFGIASITSQFFYECCKLVDFGLTGGFVENTRTGKEITGTIVFDQFHPAYIPLQGITYKTDDYSYDVLANQMIKSAIKKVMWSDKRPTQRKQYESLLKKFDQIQEFKGSLAQLDDIAKSFYSANPHYPLVLEFSMKIDTFSLSNSSTTCLKRTCFKFKIMLVTSSFTPGTVANSCSTPSILIVLIAKPSNEERRIRRKALPTVIPKPGSSGLNSNLPNLESASNINTLSGF